MEERKINKNSTVMRKMMMMMKKTEGKIMSRMMM